MDYAADVPVVDVGPYIDLCAKISALWEAYTRLQRVLFSPKLTLILWTWQGRSQN